jgi:DNA-binding transcriptional regulator YhcF (GntR family)
MADEFAFLGRLDPTVRKPPSEQIADRIRDAIDANQLGPGDRLPSHNDLTERYGVARETVKRAIEILRRERLVMGRQGRGVFVCSPYRCSMPASTTHEPAAQLVNDRPLRKYIGELPVSLVFTTCTACGVVMAALQADDSEVERDEWQTYGDLVVGLRF